MIKDLNTNETNLTKEEQIELEEMNHSEQCFIDGMYSDRLPSEVMIENSEKSFQNRLL